MSTYTDLVLADGAAAFWPLNDLAAPYASATGGNSLTVAAGTVTPRAASLAAGEPTITIAGQLSHASAPPGTFNGTADFTIEAWLQVPSAQASNPVYFGNSAINGFGLYVGAPGGGTGLLLQGLMGGVALVPSAVTATVGDVYHVALVFHAGIGAQMYVNGTSSGSVVAAGPNSPSASTEITFTGDVGYVAVYPAALTGTQVTDHYAIGSAVATPSVTGRHVEAHAGALDVLQYPTLVAAHITLHRGTAVTTAPLLVGGTVGRILIGAAPPEEGAGILDDDEDLLIDDDDNILIFD